MDAVPCALYVVPAGRPAPAASPVMLNDASVMPFPSDVRLMDRDVTLVAVMPPKPSGAELTVKLKGSSCIVAAMYSMSPGTVQRCLPFKPHIRALPDRHSPRRVASLTHAYRANLPSRHNEHVWGP